MSVSSGDSHDLESPGNDQCKVNDLQIDNPFHDIKFQAQFRLSFNPISAGLFFGFL